MTPRSPRLNRRGVTLIEVMCAIAVILAMSLMVWQSLHNSVEFNELLSKRDIHSRAARVTLGKLRRDLQLAYLTTNTSAIEQYRTVFVGMDENPDKLYFASLSHQRIYANTRESDQTEITVWTESSRREKGRGYILFHRESPRIDEEPAEGGRVYPLAYNVRSFNLRYLDGIKNEWVEEWDSRAAETIGRLPRAIEIGLVLIGEDPDDKDRTVDLPFLTTVMLQYSDPLRPELGNPNADLPDDLVRAVHADQAQGLNPEQIAEKNRVPVSTVNRALQQPAPPAQNSNNNRRGSVGLGDAIRGTAGTAGRSGRSGRSGGGRRGGGRRRQ